MVIGEWLQKRKVFFRGDYKRGCRDLEERSKEGIVFFFIWELNFQIERGSREESFGELSFYLIIGERERGRQLEGLHLGL